MSYRSGIIGCGRSASAFDEDPKRTHIWTHAGAYQANGRTEIVAAADINSTALANFCKKWQVRQAYTDYRSMLRNERIDLLSICTPASSHLEIAVEGCRSGVRAIWCEKPMAGSVDDADRMLEACRDVVLAVNHTRRWDPCYRTAKALLDAGRIGTVQDAVCYYTGGVANIGSHLFDTLRYLFGDVAWLRAEQAADRRPDPNLSGTVGFHGGVRGRLVGCGAASFLIFELDVLGTAGRLRVLNNGERIELWRVSDSPRYSGVQELVLQEDLGGWREERMVQAIADILGCLERGGTPACGGTDGRKALELVAAFRWSADQDAQVTLPLNGLARHLTVAG